MTAKKGKSLFAKNIITRRNKLGWSAMELAERAQIPYPTLRDIEADVSGGRPSTREAIAKALKCKVEELFREEVPAPSPGIEELAEVITKQKQEIESLKSALGDIPEDILQAIANADDFEFEAIRAVLGIRGISKAKEDAG